MSQLALLTKNWSSLSAFKWILNYLLNTARKRPTISNYKFTPICYFSIPRLCRWKVYWKASWNLCFTGSYLQSNATTASLYLCLACWNPLVYLKTNMPDNSQFSDKNFVSKLAALMALSSASRVSTLEHLNIKFMTRNCQYYFLFS